jgi:1,4-alpha-glucan branching enzyme
VFLVPLDRAAIDRVWHPRGYPGHWDYRDSHRLTRRAHAVWSNDGEPYDPERGHARAKQHAREFIASRPGVVAFDTELFGHFWHEGIAFLEAVLELAEVVPVEAHESRSAPDDVPATSWGEGRDLRTWSAPAADGLAWAQRGAELAALGAEASPRALRELLALQSSDWAFLIARGTAGDYPRKRADLHREAFRAALRHPYADELRNLAPQLAQWAFVQP